MSDPNLLSGPGYKVTGCFIKGSPKVNSWVARVTGKSQVFSYASEEVAANGGINYLHKAGDVPRGTKTWYLPDGVYEFYMASERGDAHQSYGRIKDGQLQPLSKEEVVQWVQS